MASGSSRVRPIAFWLTLAQKESPEMIRGFRCQLQQQALGGSEAYPHNQRKRIWLLPLSAVGGTLSPFESFSLVVFAAAIRSLASHPEKFEKEKVMDWNRVEGNWKQVKGTVKEKWGKLTDDDLTAINGKRDQLEGKIQERYGIAKDQARKDIDDWYGSQSW